MHVPRTLRYVHTGVAAGGVGVAAAGVGPLRQQLTALG
jgi:hypothetical protein